MYFFVSLIFTDNSFVIFPLRFAKLEMFTVYPETRNRSLESIEALFSTNSPFYWRMEQAYKLHGDVLASHGVQKKETNDRPKSASITTCDGEPECSAALTA